MRPMFRYDGKHAYGGVFQARLQYAIEKHGKKGFENLINMMKEHGYAGPESIEEFKASQKYPLNYLVIMLESYGELFGEEDVYRMTREASKRKGIAGFFIKWAGSPELVIKKAPEYWPQFFDYGHMSGEVLDEKSGIIHGFNVSPDPRFCDVLSEYVRGVLDNIRTKAISIEHNKCVHKGDEHCEWYIKWER